MQREEPAFEEGVQMEADAGALPGLARKAPHPTYVSLGAW